MSTKDPAITEIENLHNLLKRAIITIASYSNHQDAEILKDLRYQMNLCKSVIAKHTD